MDLSSIDLVDAPTGLVSPKGLGTPDFSWKTPKEELNRLRLWANKSPYDILIDLQNGIIDVPTAEPPFWYCDTILLSPERYSKLHATGWCELYPSYSILGYIIHNNTLSCNPPSVEEQGLAGQNLRITEHEGLTDPHGGPERIAFYRRDDGRLRYLAGI